MSQEHLLPKKMHGFQRGDEEEEQILVTNISADGISACKDLGATRAKNEQLREENETHPFLANKEEEDRIPTPSPCRMRMWKKRYFFRFRLDTN